PSRAERLGLPQPSALHVAAEPRHDQSHRQRDRRQRGAGYTVHLSVETDQSEIAGGVESGRDPQFGHAVQRMRRVLVLLALTIAASAQAQTAACTQSSALTCGANSATLTASDCASFDGSY